MKKLIAVFMIILISSFTASAQNTPCSGKKGGISHCEGSKFVCNNGSYSKSKKSCSGYGEKNQSSNITTIGDNNKTNKKKQK